MSSFFFEKGERNELHWLTLLTFSAFKLRRYNLKVQLKKQATRPKASYSSSRRSREGIFYVEQVLLSPTDYFQLTHRNMYIVGCTIHLRRHVHYKVQREED